MPIVFLVALAVSADPAKEQLQRAVALYEQVHFQEAYTLLDDVLRSGDLKSKRDLAKAKRFAAFSLFWLKRKDEARSRLREYFRMEPSGSINADDSPPELVAFFGEVKAATVEATKPAPPPPPVKRQHVVVEPPPPVVKEAIVATQPPHEVGVVTQKAPPPPAAEQPQFAPWYLKILPFGVGQLANRDYVSGGIYLGVDVALLGANLAVYFMRTGQRDVGGTFGNVSQAETLRWTANGLAIGLYAMLAWNIIDAFVLSDGRVASKLRAAVLPTANGAALVGSF